MDLKKERQIKFWLTTISKVLIIALVLFKLIDVLFNKDESNNPDDPATTTTLENSKEGDTVTTNLEETNTLEVVPSEKQSKTSSPAQTKLSDNLQNDGTKTSESDKPKTSTTAKSSYAEVQLQEKGFIWLQESKKVILQLSNPTLADATSLNATAVLDYGNQTKSIIFPEHSTMTSKTTLTLEAPLSNLPQTTLPTRILLCITHGTTNLDKKTAHRYMLGNRISGSGAIEVRSFVYRVISTSNSLYSSAPPSCNISKSNSSSTSAASSSEASAKDENLEKIKSTARLFLNGLNNKSLMTVKSTSSKKLYDHIASGDHKNYVYGFSTKVEVVSSNASSAIVRIGLTEKGRANYLNFESSNSGKTIGTLFDFLQRDGGNWKGKLVNQNGLWKFDFL